MSTFGWASDYIDWELDGVQGWAYYNWARENRASVFGSGIEPKTKAYVGQEYEKLMQEYRKANGKRK